MDLRIVHVTGFEYDGHVTASYNEARMTPQTSPGQLVTHTRLDVQPMSWSYSYRDYFGTQVTSFEVLDPHDSLTVTATATVHTDRRQSVYEPWGWEEVRGAATQDEFNEHLLVDERVAPTDDLTERVSGIAREAATPGEAARGICDLVHREVEYKSGSTEVSGLAADSWDARQGVCQDMAHLVIGGLRTVGIPARYVSGYLHPRKEPEVGDTVRGESHAWVEWWDGDWAGFDPTNDQAPGDRHVVVATGRDYTDVRPLSGIFTGAGTSSMFVDVHVTRID